MWNNSTAEIDDPAPYDPCLEGGSSPTYLYHRSRDWYVYTGLMVVYSFGLIGNVLSLLAFKKQSAASHSYYHQLSIIVSDTLNIILDMFGQCGYVYLNVWDGTAPAFIQRTPLLLFFTLCYSLADMAATASLIIMVGMCLDRLYALYKPMKYAAWPQKRMAVALFVLAYTVGSLTNLQEALNKQIVWEENRDSYTFIQDHTIRTHPIAVFMSQFQSILCIILMAGLLVCILLISRKYTSLMKDAIHPTTGRENSRPVNEKTLTRLLLAQSGLVVVGMTSTITFRVYYKILAIPWCEPLGMILEQTDAVLAGIQESANFLIYIGISRKFRQAVRAVVQRKELESHTTVPEHNVPNAERWKRERKQR